MGSICPVNRDPKPISDIPILEPPSPPPILSPDSILDIFSPEVNLRGDESIIRLTRPLEYYYRVISEDMEDRDVRVIHAEFFGSRMPCCIKAFPKHNFNLPTGKKAAIFQKLMKIDHPNILKTYEICQDDYFLYIVNEFTASGSMASYLAKHGFLSEPQAQKTIRQILSALCHCHQLGIVHKTTSLDCVLIKEIHSEELFNVRLAGVEDFDLRGYEGLEKSPFAPPEAHRGIFCEKGDLWSCGVILYILLSGRYPFDSYNGSSPMPRAKGFTFPQAVWCDISKAAVDLITRMLVKRPEARPTALECMQHTWFKSQTFSFALDAKDTKLSLHHIMENRVDTPLKKAILLFMIERVVDPLEIEHLSKTFTLLDSDGSGFITKDELVRGLMTFFEKEMTECQAIRITAKVDQNFNGAVDFSEFLLAAFDMDVLLSPMNLKRAFKSLDRDNSGKISCQELKHFFRVNNTSGTIDQWKTILAEFDLSGDGEIDFSEFELLMTKSC